MKEGGKDGDVEREGHKKKDKREKMERAGDISGNEGFRDEGRWKEEKRWIWRAR